MEANTKNNIYHLERLSQPIEFKGMDIGPKMFPSDIDACIEYKDKAYIIYELKYNGKQMSKGQQIMLERITRDLGRLKPTLTLLVGHDVQDPRIPVNLAQTYVRAMYSSSECKWRHTKPMHKNTKEVTLEFLRYIESIRERRA